MKPTPQDGDCWPCCLANLFEVPFETVADLSCRISPDDWFEKTEAWLRERGLFYLQIVASPDKCWPFHQLPGDLLAIATGSTENNTSHCVVVRIHCDEQSIELEPVFQPFGPLAEITGLVFFPKLFPAEDTFVPSIPK